GCAEVLRQTALAAEDRLPEHVHDLAHVLGPPRWSPVVLPQEALHLGGAARKRIPDVKSQQFLEIGWRQHRQFLEGGAQRLERPRRLGGAQRRSARAEEELDGL